MPEVVSSRSAVKGIAEVLVDIKEELISFVQTRLRMAHSEFRETSAAMKASLPLMVFSAALAGTAFLLFSLALVSIVAMAFGNALYRWPLAFFIVSILWGIGGLGFGLLAKNRMKNYGRFPQKTVEVLKADGLWLRDEVKSA